MQKCGGEGSGGGDNYRHDGAMMVILSFWIIWRTEGREWDRGRGRGHMEWGPGLKTRRAGGRRKRSRELWIGVTGSWNGITSCQSTDPDPGR